jgi:ATP phosphoribosyltransferase regulatory subunit
MADQKWRMPAGIDEWLPPGAWQLEQVRRRVLDVFRSWGYEYIEPPVVEYLDTLLVGAGDELDLQTLKVVDQRSGRLLGVRADMTAQAVRVDAHSRPLEGVARLCYAGNLVFANPASSVDTRSQLKAGAELFGSTSLNADAEVVALMIEVLAQAEVLNPVIVLGHMGIYQSLVAELDIGEPALTALFAAVQSKAETDIRELLPHGPITDALVALPALMGPVAILDEARALLGNTAEAIPAALSELEELASLVTSRAPQVSVRFDLSELAGYGYHNGPVFSAYHADRGQALARGGRYDGIGAEFGRPRPATGFDVSLTTLVTAVQPESGIWAPWVADDERELLEQQIAQLRAAGEIVVVAIDAGDTAPEICRRELISDGASWSLRDRTTA